MENVFYKCNVDHVFDLKGSTRSRYVDEDADSGVLMDENLLECVSGAPHWLERNLTWMVEKEKGNLGRAEVSS
jgi:hypothetical protein